MNTITKGQWVAIALTTLVLGVPVGAFFGVFIANSETGMIIGALIGALVAMGALAQQFEARNNRELTTAAAKKVLDES